jgi:hypothetical protein
VKGSRTNRNCAVSCGSMIFRPLRFSMFWSALESSKSASNGTIFINHLRNRTLAMVFENASTSTQISFEAGMYQPGGLLFRLTTNDTQLGRSEPLRIQNKRCFAWTNW